MESVNMEQIDFDKLNLEELPTEQLTSMQKTLQKLVAAVQEISKNGTAQVKLSVAKLRAKVEALQSIPSALKNQNELTRAQARTSENLVTLASNCIETECEEISSELKNLEGVEELLQKQDRLLCKALRLTISCARATNKLVDESVESIEIRPMNSTKVIQGPTQSTSRVSEEDHPHTEEGNEHMTLLASDDRLNLRFRCSCGLFGQMAHVAIPNLKQPLARAKTVNDMFQLANIASISEQECWSDERKELELRRKHSQYLTPYGLAVAIDAHRRRCPLYAKRVEEAKGVRYDHPAIYPWPCEYPIGDILAEAIMMLDQIEMPLLDHHMDRRTFIALPPSFARLDSEISYEDNVMPHVYRDFGTLANKLLTAREIMKAIVIVWPDKLPESRQMRQLLISIERHLQDGGTLAFVPSL
ncbi:unnamed protein product [Cylicocyclus nassatus]|uniref:Uncharacterized protein n=1 Tax=Cylicocyclus nassatus TaxID=53992 RepID=A0AA36GNB8_CYLNA|nr:unnamed protein product [Cylicocyclus nassatus]